MAAHSSILAWEIPMDRGDQRVTVHELQKNRALLRQINLLSLLSQTTNKQKTKVATVDFHGWSTHESHTVIYFTLPFLEKQLFAKC